MTLISRIPKTRAAALAVVVAASLVITACGPGSEEKATAARLVPSDAQGFATVALDPSKSQKSELYQLSQKMPQEVRAEDGEKVKVKLIDQLLKDTGLTYDTDLKPWIGSEAAIAALKPYDTEKEPLVVAYIKTKDEAKTRETMKKKNVDENTYKFVDGYVVIVDKEDFDKRQGAKALTAVEGLKTGGENLQKSDRYTKSIKALHDERLGFGWIDTPSILDTAQVDKEIAKESDTSLRDEQTKLVKQVREMGAVSFSLYAKKDAGVMQAVTERIPSEGNKTINGSWIAALPATTVGALDIPDITPLRDAAKKALQEQSSLAEYPQLQRILDKLGNQAAVAVGNLDTEGGKRPEIGGMIATSDAAGVKSELDSLVAKLRTDGASDMLKSADIPNGSGYVLSGQDGKEAFVMGVSGERVILASTQDYAKSLATTPSSELKSTAGYAGAIDSSSKKNNAGLFYIDLQKVVEFQQKHKDGLNRLGQSLNSSVMQDRVTPPTTSAPSKTEEEWLAHLQSAGIQSWTEDNRVFSEMRISLK